MDGEFQGLIWTLILDTLFLFICYQTFQRLNRDKAGDAQSGSAETKSLLAPSKASSADSRYTVSSRPIGAGSSDAYLDEGPADVPLPPSPLLHRLFGPFGFQNSTGGMYLRLLQASVLAFGVLAVLGLSVLVPLYTLSDKHALASTWLQQTAAGNLPFGSTKQWVVFGFTVIVSVMVYIVAWNFLEDARQLARPRVLDSEPHTPRTLADHRASHTVHLQGLDWRVVDEALLKQYFDERFPGRVERVYIARDMSSLTRLQSQREELLRDLERAQILEARKGHRTKLACCCNLCDSGADALDYYDANLKQLDQDIQTCKKEIRRGTGHAFIVFRGFPDANQLSATGRDPRWKSRGIDDSEFEFSLAPHPSDIIWDNLAVSAGARFGRSVLINFTLFIVMVRTACCQLLQS